MLDVEMFYVVVDRLVTQPEHCLATKQVIGNDLPPLPGFAPGCRDKAKLALAGDRKPGTVYSNQLQNSPGDRSPTLTAQ